MTVSKFAVRMILLGAAVVSAVAALTRTDSVVLRGFFQLERGGAPTSRSTELQCRQLLRVVNVKEDDVLHLRQEPNPRAPIIRDFVPGTRNLVDLGERIGSWRRVTYRGDVGFVHSAFVIEDTRICLPAPRRWKEQDAAQMM
jgi:hypothetical protein